MSDEDPSVPIVIYGPGLTELPGGSWELIVEAPTEVCYVTLPESLRFAEKTLFKCGWNRATGYARYRTGWDTIEEAMKHLL
jgi:hypothetical protein